MAVKTYASVIFIKEKLSQAIVTIMNASNKVSHDNSGTNRTSHDDSDNNKVSHDNVVTNTASHDTTILDKAFHNVRNDTIKYLTIYNISHDIL
jgi:hypothetical protein